VAKGIEPREPPGLRVPGRGTPPPAAAPETPGTLTYDPGTRGSSGSVVDLAREPFTNPVGLVVRGLRELFGGSGSSSAPWRGRKIVADGATGKLSVVTPPQINVLLNRQSKLRDQEASSIEGLQKTFDTGLVQAGIAPWYSEFANALAAFRIEIDSAGGPGGHVPPPDFPTDPNRGEGFPNPPTITQTPDERGGPVGGEALNKPIDLGKLFMPTNPYMPFSGLPSPRGNGAGVRRRRKKKARATSRRRRRARSSTRGRLVKGSAAARRRMAQLRAMRRR
jgi:hypothetical protein